MRITVCGSRGSTPSPGPGTVRYGGETSCLAIGNGGDPALILDAGTGLRRFASLVGARPFRGALVLTHLHWDHTHGLPFFSAGDRPDAEVRLFLPRQADGAHDLLAKAMSPPNFPIEPWQLRGKWSFDDFEPGTYDLEGFSVTAREIPHGGGRTFGYRVSDGTSSIAYLSDHSPIRVGPGDDGLGVFHDDALALAEGVDVLLHDSQYTAEEFPARAAFGHSAIEYAIELARRAGAKRILLFHHDPRRTDDEVDALVAAHQNDGVAVAAAAERMELQLPEAG